MPMAEAVPHPPVALAASGWLTMFRGVLLRPRATFCAVRAGPVAPAAKLTAISLFFPALAAVLTDDELWLGRVPNVIARGLMMWFFGSVWLLGPQAVLFRLVLRLFGANRPLAQAQHGMAAFSALLAVFGVVLSVAGISPESAPFVITWYLAIAAVIVLGTHALYRLAEGAYGLPAARAAGAVIVFQFMNTVALVIALGVLFTIVSP